MKILQLCKKFPYPLKDGESIAVTYLSHALSELGCKVSLLAMNTTKHYTNINSLPEDYNQYASIHVANVDNKVNVMGAFRNLFSKDSYHISRFISQEFAEKLISLLQNEQFDVIQLETLYLAPYIDIIKKNSNALITMRAHNVEFEIWERISNNTQFLPKKWYLRYLTQKLKNYELSRLNDYDYLVAVSERDLKKFKELGYKNGAISSPIGLDLKQYNVKPSIPNSKDLYFIGAMDWLPNIEGLKWFLEQVWPQVSINHKDIKLHIAGRNTPEWLTTQYQNDDQVIIHGEVENAIEFVKPFDTMIVPLFSGSGMRVKILEGMALGKTIITTTLGKEGIDAEHGKHLIVADTPEAFISEIKLVSEGHYSKSFIANNAQKFVNDYYDHSRNAAKLLEKYNSLLNNPKYSKA
jgi:glycosyltransferase involved in cell wall biosynthesis